MARTGETWTCSTPSGLRPGRCSCGAPDSIHRRRSVGAVPVLGPVHGGPVVVQRQLSLLVGVQYIDKLLMCSCDAVAGPLHGALLRNAWLYSEYIFCDSSGCVACIAVISA